MVAAAMKEGVELVCARALRMLGVGAVSALPAVILVAILAAVVWPALVDGAVAGTQAAAAAAASGGGDLTASQVAKSGALTALREADATSLLLLLGVVLATSVAFLLASLAMVRAAVIDEPFADHLTGSLPAFVPQLAQSGLLFAPFTTIVVLAVLALSGGTAGLVVGVLLLLAGCVVALATLPLAVFSIISTALGDTSPRPSVAISLARANLHEVILLAVCSIGVSIGASLVAGVLGLIPVLGVVAALVISAAVSLWTIAAWIAMFQHLDASSAAPGASATTTEPPLHSPTGATTPTEPSPAAHHTPSSTSAPAAPTQPHICGGVLHPGVPAGEWVAVEAAGTAHLEIAWSEGPALQLAVATQTGAWLPLEQPSQNGQVVALAVPGAGHIWLHVATQSPQPQSWRIVVHPPAAATSAA